MYVLRVLILCSGWCGREPDTRQRDISSVWVMYLTVVACLPQAKATASKHHTTKNSSAASEMVEVDVSLDHARQTVRMQSRVDLYMEKSMEAIQVLTQ